MTRFFKILIGTSIVLILSTKMVVAKENQSGKLGEKASYVLQEALNNLQTNRFAESLLVLEEAIVLTELTPYESSMIYQVIGSVYCTLENKSDAITAFENAIEAGGLLPSEKNNLAARIAEIRDSTVYCQAGAVRVSDRDAKPLVRFLPKTPKAASNPGHCQLRFNVTEYGQPVDIVAVYCTDSIFERNAIESVRKWKFDPKIIDGRAVVRSGTEAQIRFKISD